MGIPLYGEGMGEGGEGFMSKCLWNDELIFLSSFLIAYFKCYFYFKRAELNLANGLYENGVCWIGFSPWYYKKKNRIE